MPSDITQVCALARAQLGIDDPQIVQFALATAASVYDSGPDRLWSMLIGPSSSGKTTTTLLFGDVPHEARDDLTSASLLHWVQPKNKDEKGHEAGILPTIGDVGFLVVSDFSPILAMSNRGIREQLFSYLRRVYDGSLDREVAYAPTLHWEGRLTLFAACTSAIDNYSSYQGELGPRFIYLRLTPRDLEDHRGRLKAARNYTRQPHMTQIAAAECIAKAIGRYRDVEIDDDLADLLDDAAIVTVHGRTSVPRDGYKHEVDGHPETEEAWRFRAQLRVLARSCLALGMDAGESGLLCARVARDSMPKGRRDVLGLLARNRTEIGLSAGAVARLIGTDRHVTARELEDLAFAGMCERTTVDWGERESFLWTLSDAFRDLVLCIYKTSTVE